MIEQWRPVVGYENLYEVSDFGRVRSLTRIGSGKRKRYGGIVLRQFKNKTNGYLYLTLCDDIGGKERVSRRVHALVLAAFVGPRPSGDVTRHLNGDRTDNRLSNLAYGTHVENAADRVAHGTALYGERHPRAKLTDEQVAEIRSLRGKVRQVELAKRFGVSQAAISDAQLRPIVSLGLS